MNLLNSEPVTNSYYEVSSEQAQQTLNNEIGGFDYTTLTPGVRLLVQGKTFELKSLIRRSAQDVINIGQKLVEVKEQLGHGNFRAWLKAEFDWSVRTASRFMQVATKFKCANLAHLDIAVSALYLLAESSTPEEAREQALELAKQGENINRTKAKEIVSQNQKSFGSNTSKPVNLNLSDQPGEDSSLTPNIQFHSQNILFQLKTEDETKRLEASIEVVPTIELENGLEYEEVEKINSISKEDSEVITELHHEHDNSIRILDIQNKNSGLPSNITQTFEMTFAHICVNFEGDPKVLIVLFEQMQNNPAFTKKVMQEAKLLASNNNKCQ